VKHAQFAVISVVMVGIAVQHSLFFAVIHLLFQTVAHNLVSTEKNPKYHYFCIGHNYHSTFSSTLEVDGVIKCFSSKARE
jgi:hypothetical protein